MPGERLPITDPVMLATYSKEAIGVNLMATANSGTLSAGTFSANVLYAIPFVVLSRFVVTKGFAYAQTGLTTDVDVGVYDESYNLLASSGAINFTSANDIKEVDIGPITLGPGRYYMACAAEGALPAAVLTVTNADMRGMGAWYVGTVGCPLPSSVTPAAWTSTSLPVFGLSQRSLVA